MFLVTQLNDDLINLYWMQKASTAIHTFLQIIFFYRMHNQNVLTLMVCIHFMNHIYVHTRQMMDRRLGFVSSFGFISFLRTLTWTNTHLCSEWSELIINIPECYNNTVSSPSNALLHGTLSLSYVGGHHVVLV